MVLTIQHQKVAEISEGMMRMMGLDLVEKATLMRNQSQSEFIKSGNLWLILRILVKGKFSTSLLVSDHLFSYYFRALIAV